MPKQVVVRGLETDDCGGQIEALKNGRGNGSCPMEMCHEGSAINILIKASQALENPREETAFSSHTGAQTQPPQQKICQYCIVRVLGFPKA